MPSTTKSTAFQPYEKTKILSALRDASSAMERAKKTFEEELEEWRTEAPKKFAEFVNEFDPKNQNFYRKDWAPPEPSKLCSDYRFQELNRQIARITTMMPDDKGIIKLRADDNVFSYVGIDACL